MREKVLYISAFSPFSIKGGGNQRSHFLLETLLKRYDVDLIVDFDKIEDSDFSNYNNVHVIKINSLDKITYYERAKHLLGLKLGWYPYEILMKTNLGKYKYVHEIIRNNNYKFIIVRYLFMVSYHRLYDFDNLIIDIDDLPALKFESRILSLNRNKTFKEKYIINKMEKVTNALIDRALCSFLPSKNQIQKASKCYYLPNIPIVYNEQIERNPKQKIIFIGSLSQHMNFNGVDHFIKNIWPFIIEKFPNIEFHIIGGGLNDELKHQWLKTKGIIIRGFVDNIALEYSTSLFSVVPIYSGAGTNIKVIESLMCKCPVIISEFAMRGYENIFINKKNIRIAKDDKDFISSICDYISNPNLAELVAQNGYLSVKNEYTIDKFCEYFYQGIKNIGHDKD